MPRLTPLPRTVNGWTVQDLPDGRVHIWKDFASGNVTMSGWGSTMADGLLFSSTDYPFTFAALPEFWVTVRSTNDVELILANYAGGTVSKTPKFYAGRPNVSTANVNGTMHAIGTPATT